VFNKLTLLYFTLLFVFSVHVRYMSSSVRPSVCLSVCLSSVRSCTLLRRLKFSAMFLRHLIRWPSDDIQVKFYGDRPRGTPPFIRVHTVTVVLVDIYDTD